MALTRAKVRENVDLLILLVVLSFLIAVSLTYPERTRQVPLIFLTIALLLVLVEMVVVLLPRRYSRRFAVLTEGLASDIEDLADDEDLERERTEIPERAAKPDDMIGLWPTTGAIVLFFLISYLVGMLWAIPVFVFTIFWLTSRNWVVATITSVVLMVIALFVFGNLMNVPILTGII